MVVSALQKQDVPPDRECDISNLTEILQGVVDFVTVVTNQSQVNDGSGTSNAIAQQALQVANLALQTAQAAQAAIPQTRANQVPTPLPAVDSTVPLVWTEPLPNTNYSVSITYEGGTTFPTLYFNWYLEAASKTTTGCRIRFNNTPANFSFTYVVTSIPTP